MGKKTKNTITCKMLKDKETKGAVRYSEDSETFPKNVYFRKEELQEAFGDWPEAIEVTFSAV